MSQTLSQYIPACILADYLSEEGVPESLLTSLRKSGFTPFGITDDAGYGYGFSSCSAGVDTATIAVEISTEQLPWGEWTPFGAVECRRAPCRKTYLVVQGRTTRPNTCRIPSGTWRIGDTFTIDSEGYYSEHRGALVDAGHDICLYCGADNGPNGESRQGWDCCWCGSN